MYEDSPLAHALPSLCPAAQTHMLVARLRPVVATSTKRVGTRSLVSMFGGKKEKAAASAAEAEEAHPPHEIVLGTLIVR